MKVKIIVGTYGYRPDKSHAVLLKDSKSEPFVVSDEEGKRLVSLGIAESLEVEEPEDDYSKMSINQLKHEAASRGLSSSGSKADLIARLEADTDMDLDLDVLDDLEEPPILTAAEPEK